MGLPPDDEIDADIEAIANLLLKQGPDNPCANYYLGSHHQANGNDDQANVQFRHIVNAENF